MLDLAVTSLERVLVKEKVEIREAKDKFLQEVLPYFSALLDFETGSVKESPYSLTVQEASLEKEQVQRKCISFLGSLGSDLLYIARGRAKEHELEQGEADALKISIPINKHRINISLSHVIKRSSQLALESPSEEVQAAASELFHGSMIVFDRKVLPGRSGWRGLRGSFRERFAKRGKNCYKQLKVCSSVQGSTIADI
jgi:hypothetical protein